MLRDEDMAKIQSLGKTASESAIKVLPELYKLPIVNVHTIQSWTGFTKQGAQNVIDRFIDLDILRLKDENISYGRSFIYKRYVDIFTTQRQIDFNANESLTKEQKIELFRSLFKGREDVFAQRWESQDGQRSAYYPAYTNRDKTDHLPLSDWLIED